MQWRGRSGSSNVEDRRGGGGGRKLVGGGIGGIILVIVVTLLSGGNPGDILNNLTNTGSESNAPYEQTAEEEELSQFVSVVLKDTEDVWTELFEQRGLTYEEPTLVLYTDSVDSACGEAGSSVGPFYCPADYKLYIDLSFYDELRRTFEAPGDFAMAYVIAHEVGHHVQTLLGTMEEVNAVTENLSETDANKYSVNLELQADYLAGVWANHAQGMGVLEEGDIEEALTAASAVGDDSIQKKSQGYVVPESFTHGTSAQRKKWFDKGFQTGTIEGGDTFKQAS